MHTHNQAQETIVFLVYDNNGMDIAMIKTVHDYRAIDDFLGTLIV